MKILIQIFIIILFFFVSYDAIDANDCTSNYVSGYVYPEAMDCQMRVLDSGKIVDLYYRINSTYPDDSVYIFYSTILKKQGYEEIFWKGQILGEWFNYIDGTIKGEPVIHAFIAYWSDSERKKLFVLTLRYYSKKIIIKENPDNDIQHVYFKQSPYVSLEQMK